VTNYVAGCDAVGDYLEGVDALVEDLYPAVLVVY